MEFFIVGPARKKTDMEYIIKDGLRVCHRGFVIIEGVEHYVNEGYVFCNPSLNQRAWGITQKEGECEICKQFQKPKTGQLSLF